MYNGTLACLHAKQVISQDQIRSMILKQYYMNPEDLLGGSYKILESYTAYRLCSCRKFRFTDKENKRTKTAISNWYLLKIR